MAVTASTTTRIGVGPGASTPLSHAVMSSSGGAPRDADIADMVAWVRSCIKLRGFSPQNWTEECSAVAEAFLLSPESFRMMGYMSERGELCLYLGNAGALGGATRPRGFVYWIKRSPGTPLTMATLRQSVLFGAVNSGGIASLARLVGDVYLPGVKNTANEWPGSVRGELTGQVQASAMWRVQRRW